MELSNNLDEAIEEAKSHLRKNIQVKLLVKYQGKEYESSPVFIRKLVPEKMEQIRRELVMRFETKEFEKIHLEISKIPIRKAKCPNCNKEMRSNHLSRHLESCVKNWCVICRKSAENLEEHMKECGVRYYYCNVCGEKFNTGGRRTAHQKKCKVQTTTKEAIGGLFKIIKFTPQDHPDFESILEEEVTHISDILRYELKTSMKFYISLEVRVYLELKDESMISHFQSSATLLTNSSNFEEQVRNHHKALVEKIENYTNSTSGWLVENIKAINIMVTHLN